MSTTTEDLTRDPFLSRARLAFRYFRWRRPFWAGLFTMIAGLPIVYFPYAHVTLGDLTIRMSTTAGAGSLVIGVLLMVLGLVMWFQPQVRIFAGVAAILLALVSLVVSNFGGFLVGFIFGLVGGAMGVAWVPGQPGPQAAERKDAAGGDPPPATPGTGSALAGFGGTGATPGEGTTPGKGRHRAE
ncbi:DUF6114 domain-containing protein [Streptomyces sp. 6N223]|uniref:DUF6114 domain-containing protein n=1 Tax=Streptomyces sp. 6N223 TaxID=3457412 RepID=UPI003FD4EDE0